MKRGELEKARRTEAEMTKLEQYRRAAGLTQRELAERSGVHIVTISRIERGAKGLGLSTIKKVAPVLGIGPEMLF